MLRDTYNSMKVLKRNEKYENVDFNKILQRLQKLNNKNPEKKNSADDEHDLDIDETHLAQDVINRLYDGIPTSELDEYASKMCANYISTHPDYGILASRIIISNHHKQTTSSFSEAMDKLWENGQLNTEFYTFVDSNRKRIDSEIDHAKDFNLTYFGFKTLEYAYLSRNPITKNIIERPQYVWMRVSIAMHMNQDIEEAFHSYRMMADKYFIHASPTLFNAGGKTQQCSSCFLCQMQDTIEGQHSIGDTIKDQMIISKYAGGVGTQISDVRAKDSIISSTGGRSNGVMTFLKHEETCFKWINQSGKRQGSNAVYLEPWHADIRDFLYMRRTRGAESQKIFDLFHAIWMNDLFMERLLSGASWSLFSPNEAPGLTEVYGEDFKALYERYELEGRYREQVDPNEIWKLILESQKETGTPYLTYKDTTNRKSNQKNIGMIKSLNLCTEITEHASETEIAVCNLTSVCLARFVSNDGFDYSYLKDVIKQITRNLNRVIDVNYHPTWRTENSNLKHRPIGIGVNGLADVFFLMRIPFEKNGKVNPDAQQVNEKIFETIYFGALETSCELAKEREEIIRNGNSQNITIHDHAYRVSDGKKITSAKEIQYAIECGDELCYVSEKNLKYPGSYSTFEGSPMEIDGTLQPDFWNKELQDDLWNWTALREKIKKHGVRNSLLVAPMPTVSSSTIMGYTESFEPITQNIYTRSTISGKYIVINSYLVRDLIQRGIWNTTVKNKIMENNGEICGINEIPEDLQELYKCAYEMKARTLIDLSIGRASFVDQSQSLNLYMKEPTYNKLSAMHIYSWKSGLKTGMYYLKTAPAVIPKTLGGINEENTKEKIQEESAPACSKDTNGCVSCSA